MTTLRAAGILFVAPGNRALFIKRAPNADHPGEWCFPGGGVEGDESPEQTADREAIEEVGPVPAGVRALLSRVIAPKDVGPPDPTAPAPTVDVPAPPEVDMVDFTTYAQRVAEEFSPVLSSEHVGWAWAPITDPPGPLHPGCSVAIEMLSADELGIARLMAAGRIVSPWRYKNVVLWAMRITGTGVSYRPKVGEFVFRDPTHYLSDEFLARCNGLSVVMYHPKKSTLDSDSFEKSAIGSIMLPYVKGNEVWGIAKIYDDEANAAMTAEQLSTSPGVVLAHPDSPSYKLRMEGGEKILIEGKPSLLDHVAVCALGVWDKGGDPAGIILNDSTGEHDMPMTAEEKKEITDSIKGEVMDAVRKDADERGAKLDATLDKVLKGIDSVGCRLDSVEKADSARADAAKKDADEAKEKEEKAKADAAKKDEEMKSDAAKKDAEEKEKEEKMKADAAQHDAATKVAGPLLDRIAAVEAALPKARTDADRSALVAVQAKFDPLYLAFGDSAPAAMNGETVVDYRIRLAGKFKDHSPTWKAANLSIIAGDSAALDAAEGTIFNDAMAAALAPSAVAEGELKMIPSRSESGHRINRFVGEPRVAFARFTGGRRCLPNMTEVLQKHSNGRERPAN